MLSPKQLRGEHGPPAEQRRLREAARQKSSALDIAQDHWHRRQAEQSKENPLSSPAHHFAYVLSVASMLNGVSQGGFLLLSAARWNGAHEHAPVTTALHSVFANEPYTSRMPKTADTFYRVLSC
jgi:hypothetical protein